jgi:hypothetical protein
VETDKSYDFFIGPLRPEFVSRDRAHAVAVRQGEVFRVEVRIRSK